MRICVHTKVQNNYNLIVLSLLTKLFKSVTLYKSIDSEFHIIIIIIITNIIAEL